MHVNSRKADHWLPGAVMQEREKSMIVVSIPWQTMPCSSPWRRNKTCPSVAGRTSTFAPFRSRCSNWSFASATARAAVTWRDLFACSRLAIYTTARQSANPLLKAFSAQLQSGFILHNQLWSKMNAGCFSLLWSLISASSGWWNLSQTTNRIFKFIYQYTEMLFML